MSSPRSSLCKTNYSNLLAYRTTDTYIQGVDKVPTYSIKLSNISSKLNADIFDTIHLYLRREYEMQEFQFIL